MCEGVKINPSLFSKSFPLKSTIDISNPNSDNIYQELQKLGSQDGAGNKILQKKYKSMKHKRMKHNAKKLQTNKKHYYKLRKNYKKYKSKNKVTIKKKFI